MDGSQTLSPKASVSFTLNGEEVTVEGASTLLSLNDWLRIQPGLSGTKKMCSEGGCGCCVVTAQAPLPAKDETSRDCKQASTIAINSVRL